MRPTLRALALATALALPGCTFLNNLNAGLTSASTSTTKVSVVAITTVDEAEVALTAAMELGTLYVGLPLCPTSTQGLACSVPATTTAILKLAVTAETDLALAQKGSLALTTLAGDIAALRNAIPTTTVTPAAKVGAGK